MKAYHATPIENRETVNAEGLYAMVTDKITLSDDQIDAEGVFFFRSIEDAKAFGVDCCGGEYVIFTAEISIFSWFINRIISTISQLLTALASPYSLTAVSK